MALPIICLDECLCQFCEAFRGCFSKPQFKYLVTVLLALIICQESRTLSGLKRQIAGGPSVSGLSRFLSEAPWSAAEVAGRWCERFVAQMTPAVQVEHARQQPARPKRRGHPKATVVTGYLIGDDSTQHKPGGKKMAGMGYHHSTTHQKRVPGHSLVQGLYLLLGRRCPLLPRLYRQRAVCEREGVAFASKIDLMEHLIRTFEPVVDTLTHVLLDAWYGHKRLWRAARERGFHITTGVKSNRWLRLADPLAPGGWRWQRLSDYAAALSPDLYQKVVWPAQDPDGPREVYVHVVTTRIRKLYKCQVIIARPTLDCPPQTVRYWASSDLQADLPTLVGHIATRWTIEVFFGETKDLLGLDQYQVMSATALLRFWTLICLAYVFLEEQNALLRVAWQRHVTLGQTRRVIQQRHWGHLLHWLHNQFSLGVTLEQLQSFLVA
jgi:hypothetical protein